MMDSEDLRERLFALQTENESLRETYRRLSQLVLNLEAQIINQEDRLSQMSQGLGLPVEALGTAVADALANANTNLAKEKREINYAISELSCDIKGFLSAVGSSLTMLPANVIDAQAANSMSVIRLSVSNIPAGQSGPLKE